jgi:integrase
MTSSWGFSVTRPAIGETSQRTSEGRFIESRARKAIADIYALGSGEDLGSSTTGDFLDGWLARKRLETGESTNERYATVVAQFKDYLGSKGGRNISSITSADVAGFRDHLAKRVATGTVNITVKILRSAFAQARRDGLVDINELERVSMLKRQDRWERRPFTLPELKLILEAATDEWKGIIMFGLYTGQRLGDLAALTWQNLDLQREEVRLVTGKTGRQMILPIAPPLLRFVERLPTSDDPAAPLFPRAYVTVQQQGRVGSLSNQFYGILVSAGLAPKRTHRATKGGRSAKRDQNDLSFHCLRHTATSLLKNAGVNEAVAMEFVGHDSKSVSQQYTNIDTATLKGAAAKLPDITLP